VRALRGVVAVAALACAIVAPRAAAAVDVACASFIGDRVTTIEREATSGTNIARRRGVANPEPARPRDRLAASAAMRAIEARKPAAVVSTVDVSGPGTERLFSTVLDRGDDRTAAAVYGSVAASIAKQVDAKRVLVIAKLEFRHWTEAYLLAGIGVFAEPGPRDMPLNDETIERRYVAPYVGAVALLFDAGGTLVAAQPIASHKTYRTPPGVQIPATAWEILSPQALNRAIDDVVADGGRGAGATLPL
jgi:hypothetical protein